MDKIAIIRRNGLGDLLCASTLYYFLKKKYPQARITFFVDARNAPLLNYFPEKIPAVVFPKKGNKYLNHFWVAWKHRKERFDLAIAAKTSPMKLMVFFLFVLRAKKQVAVADKRWQRWLLTDPVSEEREGHQALKTLRMLDATIREIPQECYPCCQIPESLHKKYAALFPARGPLLLLSASTTQWANRIDEEKYARIVNRLFSERPFSVSLIGEERDSTRAEKIAARLIAPCQLHFPRNFEEFMVLLDRSSLYFVGDGGIAHLGAALQKAVVVFFGAASPKRWGPLGKRVVSFDDPHHVNFLSEEKMGEALRNMYDEVYGGRDDVRSEMGSDPCEPFSAAASHL